MKARQFLVAALLASVPSVAVAQSDTMKGMDMSAGSPATQAYMQAMKSMQDKMHGMTPTNDPDKDFVMMMKPHHQAAVDMAEAYLKYGTDPMLKRMARGIVRSQKKEIGQMSGWEAKHGL